MNDFYYAPVIESTLQSFTSLEYVSIPFEPNRLIPDDMEYDLELQIKTLTGSVPLSAHEIGEKVMEKIGTLAPEDFPDERYDPVWAKTVELYGETYRSCDLYPGLYSGLYFKDSDLSNPKYAILKNSYYYIQSPIPCYNFYIVQSRDIKRTNIIQPTYLFDKNKIKTITIKSNKYILAQDEMLTENTYYKESEFQRCTQLQSDQHTYKFIHPISYYQLYEDEETIICPYKKIYNNIAMFNLTALAARLIPLKYYRVQIRYCFHDATETKSLFSNVGIIRYTTPPTVMLQQSSSTSASFVGSYRSNDPLERVMKYSYKVFGEDYSLKYESQKINHLNKNDTYDIQNDFFTIDTINLEKNDYVQYEVITNSSLTELSPLVRVADFNSFIKSPILEKCSFKCDLDFDNGTTCFYLLSDSINEPIFATFVISRKDALHNIWQPIKYFSLNNYTLHSTVKESSVCARDFTIEHGITYTYAIQQYNIHGVYSSYMEAESFDSKTPAKITADFEDMFLYDGRRQLKVCYNPKVSSYKIISKASKIETIDSQYPFIYRTTKNYYREFPINGLISYKSDPEQLFNNCCRAHEPNDSDLMNNIYDINLSTENMFLERKFKEDVIDFLNNPEPRLFRSPAEGNIIVSLINVSFTPEDKVSRMLNSFSCTATEINSFSLANLKKYNLIPLPEQDPNNFIGDAKVQTYVLSGQIGVHQVINDQLTYHGQELLTQVFYSGLNPGTEIYYRELNSGIIYTHIVGSTGNGYLVGNELVDFIEIHSIKKQPDGAMIVGLKRIIPYTPGFDDILSVSLAKTNIALMPWVSLGSIKDQIPLIENDTFNDIYDFEIEVIVPQIILKDSEKPHINNQLGSYIISDAKTGKSITNYAGLNENKVLKSFPIEEYNLSSQDFLFEVTYEYVIKKVQRKKGGEE